MRYILKENKNKRVYNKSKKKKSVKSVFLDVKRQLHVSTTGGGIIRPYVKEGEKVIFKFDVLMTVHRDKFL